jgi:glycosyltransferase involved in cell wall biosynthesis
MLICHVIPNLLTGGAETMLYRLLRHWRGTESRHAVVALTAEAGPLGERIRELGVPVFACRMPKPVPGPAPVARLVRIVSQLHPSVLHGWLYHGNLAAWLAGRLRQPPLPVLWSVHGMNGDLRREKPGTRLVIRLGGLLAGTVAAVVAPTQAAAAIHAEALGYRRARWEWIPNGFDPDLFAPDPCARLRVRREFGVAPETLLAGMIGRYHPVKDHRNFLEAAALIPHANVRFVLAGRGVDAANPELAALVTRLGLAGRVHLLGERPDLPGLLPALDLAVSSSVSECFPLSIGEAMACGVPCVVTRVGDAPFLVGSAGLVVPPRDPQALAAACRELINAGPERRRALGRLARDRIVTHFSLPAVAQQYERLYRRLAQQEDISQETRVCRLVS